MNIRNKNFLLFFSLFILLSSTILAELTKFLPVFLQHTVYYCQQLITHSSLQFPNLTGGALLLIPGILITLALSKLTIIVIQNWKLKNEIKSKTLARTLPVKLLREYQLQGKVYLFKDMTPKAVCIGLRSPKIYLSTKMISLMTTNELKAILIHEKHHLQERDSFIMVFATILQTLFPFFPLLSDLIKQYKVNREIDADRKASEYMESALIISVLKKLLSFPTPVATFASAIGDYDTLEQRIRVLTHRKTTRHITIKHTLYSITTLGILMGVLVVPVHAIELSTMNMNKDAMMVCLEGGACASWCKEHKTVVPFSPAQNASHMYSPAE